MKTPVLTRARRRPRTSASGRRLPKVAVKAEPAPQRRPDAARAKDRPKRPKQRPLGTSIVLPDPDDARDLVAENRWRVENPGHVAGGMWRPMTLRERKRLGA